MGLEVIHSPAVEIDSRHHIQLTLDAEPIVLSAPVRISLEPDALRVVCGPTPS